MPAADTSGVERTVAAMPAGPQRLALRQPAPQLSTWAVGRRAEALEHLNGTGAPVIAWTSCGAQDLFFTAPEAEPVATFHDVAWLRGEALIHQLNLMNRQGHQVVGLVAQGDRFLLMARVAGPPTDAAYFMKQSTDATPNLDVLLGSRASLCAWTAEGDRHTLLATRSEAPLERKLVVSKLGADRVEATLREQTVGDRPWTLRAVRPVGRAVQAVFERSALETTIPEAAAATPARAARARPFWRSSIATYAAGSRRAEYAALAERSEEPAAWCYQRAHRCDLAIYHPSGAGLHQAPGAVYSVQSAPALERHALLGKLGQEGYTVVGLHVRQADPRRPVEERNAVEVMVRQARGPARPISYTLRRTHDLQGKLAQLEANGWEVCAYARARLAGTESAAHFLVARDGEGQRFEHRVRQARTLGGIKDAQKAMAQEGFVLCGCATSDARLDTTLIFKRPQSAPLAAPSTEAGLGYFNDDILGLDEPTRTVPKALLFAARGFAFDIDALVDEVERSGVFKHQHLNTAFTDDEIASILFHPSGAGLALTALRAQQADLQAAITPASAQRILDFAEVLDADAKDGSLQRSAEAALGLLGYINALPQAEKTALYGVQFALTGSDGRPFAKSVIEIVAAVQNADGCSRASARQLRAIHQELIHASTTREAS